MKIKPILVAMLDGVASQGVNSLKCFTRLIKTPVVPALFYFTFPHTLDAYLDPGTGSIILQLVIGAVVGGLFTVALFFHRVKTFFKNLFSRAGKHERAKD